MPAIHDPGVPVNYEPSLKLPCDPLRIRSAPGSVLKGISGRQYILGTRLSSGGSASVFKVRLAGSDSHFAARLITEPKRLERELAVLTAAFDNPYALQMIDSGQWGTVPFVITELLTGGEIGSHFACNAGARTDEQVGWVGAMVASCFERLDVVHRDLKPENIMLKLGINPALGLVPGDSRYGQRAVVIDFGLCADAGAAAGVQVRVTRTKQCMGSLHYLSPEVCVDGAREAGIQADMYALGCTLYLLRADKQPFPDELMPDGMMNHHVKTKVPEHPEIQGQLRRLIRRLMSKHPADRHETWCEVKVECENIARARIDV